MAGNNNLGTIRGTIEIDYDGAGIVKANNDIDKTTKNSQKLEDRINSIGRAYLVAARRAAIMGASSLALSGSIQVVAAALATLAPIIGASLAIMPGLILGAVAAFAVMKIATLGVGDALKAASGDLATFNEALKGLSPQARSFAIAYRQIGREMKPVQQAIQDAFFTKLGPVLLSASRRAATLRAQAVGVASAINGIARNVIAWTTSNKSIENTRKILSGVNAFLLQIKGSLGPVVAAFIDLGAQASELGGDLGGVLAYELQQFAKWLGKIDVRQVFEDGLDALHLITDLFSNLYSIAKSVFSMFNVDGQSAMGVLGELVAKLAEFLESAQGQEALRALGEAMAAISGAAGQVFLALLKALAPAIVALAPGVGEFAGQLASVLVPALEALSPLLEAMAGFLSDNVEWIGPLIIAVGALVVAYKAYKIVAIAVDVVKKILTSTIIKNTAAWVANTAAVVAHGFRMAGVKATIIATTIAGWVANTAAVVKNTAALVAQKAAAAAIAVATRAAAAAQMLWNAAMMLNPIGLIILAIIALVAIIVVLWNKNEAFRLAVIWTWNQIKAGVEAVVNWFRDTAWPALQAVWDGIVTGVTAAIDFIIGYFKFWLNVYQTIWGGIKQSTTNAINLVMTIVRAWINTFLTVVNGLAVIVTRVRTWFGNVVTAIKERFNEAVAQARSLVDRIVSTVQGVGTRLYNAGRNIVSSFIRGIRDMIGAAGNAAKAVIDKVTGFFPGSPAKEGPLSGTGYVMYRGQRMMDDFATGIDGGAQRPTQATEHAIGRVAHNMAVGASTGTLTGSSSTSTGAPAVSRSVSVENVNLNGVWDFADPTAARKIVGTLHEELDRYEKEHQ